MLLPIASPQSILFIYLFSLVLLLRSILLLLLFSPAALMAAYPGISDTTGRYRKGG